MRANAQEIQDIFFRVDFIDEKDARSNVTFETSGEFSFQRMIFPFFLKHLTTLQDNKQRLQHENTSARSALADWNFFVFFLASSRALRRTAAFVLDR